MCTLASTGMCFPIYELEMCSLTFFVRHNLLYYNYPTTMEFLLINGVL
jgi:hypothetical protein